MEYLSDFSRGAVFFHADMHVHSFGGSYDVKDTSATPQAIVSKAASEGLAIIAITDHNEICNVQAAVAAGTADNILVIPGVELSTPEGHLLAATPALLVRNVAMVLPASWRVGREALLPSDRMPDRCANRRSYSHRKGAPETHAYRWLPDGCAAETCADHSECSEAD